MSCTKCNDTGMRPLTQPEMEAVLESCNPDEAPDRIACECREGVKRRREFNQMLYEANG